MVSRWAQAHPLLPLMTMQLFHIRYQPSTVFIYHNSLSHQVTPSGEDEALEALLPCPSGKDSSCFLRRQKNRVSDDRCGFLRLPRWPKSRFGLDPFCRAVSLYPFLRNSCLCAGYKLADHHLTLLLQHVAAAQKTMSSPVF